MTTASHTVSRDRKVLKAIDKDGLRLSYYSIVGYGVLFAWISTLGGGYERMPRLSVTIGVLLALFSIGRIAMNMQFDSIYGRGPARWRRIFYLLTHLHAGVWSIYLVLLILVFELTINTFLAWIYTAGLCAAIIISSSAYLYTNRAFISILLLPSITVLVLKMEMNSGLMAVCLLFFYQFLIRQAAYLFAVFWDRVELQRSHRKKLVDLQLAREAGDAADRAKNEFLSTVTHEIRTPMNSVLGMLTLLQDTELSKVQREYQSIATLAGESLLSLIDDILDFSKIMSGNIRLESSVVNLRSLIEEVVEMLGPVAHERGLELSYICDPSVPRRIRGDAGRLSQLLVNLVNNAFKYAEDGEIILEVNMTFPRVDVGLLRVHVIDHGQGLTLEQKEKIFSAFGRIGGGREGAIGGTGLGLAICKGIAECMKGEIGLISDEYTGSTFWFTAQMKLFSQQTKAFVADSKLMGLKVLVVDALPGVRRALRTEIEQWGVLVDVIDDYSKALQVLRGSARERCDIDLVIIGMNIDNSKDCLNLSSIMAEDPRLSEMKQIILTSLVQRGNTTTVLHARKVPQAVFVTKPIHRSSLYGAFVQLYQLREEGEKVERLTLRKQEVATRHHAILLAEDNKVNQMVAKGMIKKLGYEVKIVGNGKEAIGIIEDKAFDLVLMDCLMPVMDGYEATREIRRREEGVDRHIPIIAMTANTFEGEETRCFVAGMDDFLAKPVNIEELAAKLDRWLGEDVGQIGVIHSQRNGDEESGQSASSH